jgi:hypothetical protein
MIIEVTLEEIKELQRLLKSITYGGDRDTMRRLVRVHDALDAKLEAAEVKMDTETANDGKQQSA